MLSQALLFFQQMYARRVPVLVVSIFCLVFTHAAQAQRLNIYTEDWPPMNFKTKSGIDGMAVDIVQAMQVITGSKEVIQLVPWARGYKAVLEDENVLLFSLGRSPEREKLMHMLGPIAVSKTVVYTRKGEAARLKTLDTDIYKLPIGAYRGSIFADAAKKKGFINLAQADSPLNSSRMLFARRFDLWVEGSLAVNSILQESGRSVADVEEVMVLDSLELYLAFSLKTPAATITLWENALRQMKKDGSFQKIHHKWLPGETPPMEVYRVEGGH